MHSEYETTGTVQAIQGTYLENILPVLFRRMATRKTEMGYIVGLYPCPKAENDTLSMGILAFWPQPEDDKVRTGSFWRLNLQWSYCKRRSGRNPDLVWGCGYADYCFRQTLAMSLNESQESRHIVGVSAYSEFTWIWLQGS